MSLASRDDVMLQTVP